MFHMQPGLFLKNSGALHLAGRRASPPAEDSGPRRPPATTGPGRSSASGFASTIGASTTASPSVRPPPQLRDRCEANPNVRKKAPAWYLLAKCGLVRSAVHARQQIRL
jgi:hypothetical protein